MLKTNITGFVFAIKLCHFLRYCNAFKFFESKNASHGQKMIQHNFLSVSGLSEEKNENTFFREYFSFFTPHRSIPQLELYELST